MIRQEPQMEIDKAEFAGDVGLNSRRHNAGLMQVPVAQGIQSPNLLMR